MRKAEIYVKGILAGILTEDKDKGYQFTYDERYLADDRLQAVSLTLPKTRSTYHSKELFPAFSNMLSEGANKAIQSRTLKIDENDSFGLLLATARNDTIGAVTIREIL